MKIVDKNIDTALHIQLYQIIKDMIESNQLKEGASLMPERELCNLQNISRMTVNKSITNLVNEGLLEKKQADELLYNIKNKILAFEICTQNKIIRDKLEIKNEYDLIYKIKRLKIIDNEPFALETV